jgi:DNA replication protein DnaC
MGEEFKKIIELSEKGNIPISELPSKYQEFLKEISPLVPPTTISLFETHSDLPHIYNEYGEIKAKAEEKAAENEAITDDYLKRFSVPTRFISAKKADFPNKIWKEVYPMEDGLFLYGGSGSGKTHLAVAVIREVVSTHKPRIYFDTTNWRWRLARQIPPRFISIPDLLLTIRSTFEKNSETSEERIIADNTSDGIMLFDDLGAEKTTDWSLQTLYTIIDRRYREEQPTIITSNQDLESLSHKIGDRITSRIAGMCKVLFVSGGDRRLKK